MPSKMELQARIEQLEKSEKQYSQALESVRGDNRILERDNDTLTNKLAEADVTIKQFRKHLAAETASKVELANELKECKRELKALTDVTTVINDIKSHINTAPDILKKQIQELEARLAAESNKVLGLTCQLESMQPLLDRYQFLDGKVQAYELMFRPMPERQYIKDVGAQPLWEPKEPLVSYEN